MCQMKVVQKVDGREEVVMTDASLLEDDPAGVRISSLFDPPRLLAGLKVVEIDFLNGKVVLGNPAVCKDE